MVQNRPSMWLHTRTASRAIPATQFARIRAARSDAGRDTRRPDVVEPWRIPTLRCLFPIRPMKPVLSVALSCCLLVLGGCSSVDLASRRQQIMQRHVVPPGQPAAPAPAMPSSVASPAPTPPETRKIPHPPRRAPPVLVERPPVAPAAIPRVPAPVIRVPQPVGPVPPAPITSCDAGGCWSGNERYNSGGGAYLDKNGRLCHPTGTSMQCF